MKENKVIILSGPTATGKTSLGVSLAKKYRLEIINFDSLLFYRELNIGTAKPTLQEMEDVPHHLISFQSAQSPINSAQFYRLALDKTNTLHTRGVIPLFVGGSAFYLRALLKGLYESSHPSQEVLEKSRCLYEKEGIQPFQEILKEHDPVNFNQLHKNDHYRIRRAVEHYWSSGISFSSVREKWEQSHGPCQSNIHSWNLCHLHLHIEKYRHWEIIRTRSEKIVKAGLVEEVSDLLRRGFTGYERPLLSIGYKEAQQYLNKIIPTSKEFIERITIHTRQFAKAQKTFFAKITPKQTFHPPEDIQLIEQNICHFLEE